MQTYTAIIFSTLLLLGSANTSNALETENKIQSTLAFFRGSARTDHYGDRPKEGSSIRAFVEAVCNPGPDDMGNENCPHRGSGR
ncbi:MAG: hypothetical protein QNJ68_03960 [Microcoleaceae cyanobacterium MO_207.B10]|nr:hypothetical protein [Microcoleaceae cyanobacterium MO_207.B10]